MKEYSVVGKRLPRVDGVAKATGEAKYSEDIVLPNMLCGKILRSPCPHARILNIDVSRAERLRGVKTIIIGKKDVPRTRIRCETWAANKLVLALDKVRYIGDEIAAVAAIDEDIAEEALGLIEVEYEELPAVFDPEEAMKQESPMIHEVESNIAHELNIIRGDIEKGFKEADYVFEDKFVTSSVHQCYLEPMSCLASFDASGKLTLWTSSMDPSGLRLSLAEVLNMPESNVRVINNYVGGAFGGKIMLQPIYPICALLAKKTGRPVKVANNREEEFIATRPRLPAVIQQKIGVKKNGTIVVKEAKIIADNGAYLDFGVFILGRMATECDSLYRISNLKAEGKLVYTNKAPAGAFRGFGSPQMTFALESQMDEIAEKLGIDPMELRLKNATETGDVTAHGWLISSCGLKECIQMSAESINWKEKKVSKRPNYGIGTACVIYACDTRLSDGFGGSVAYIKILEDGKISIISGESEYGQGAHNVFAQIAAEELGVPLEDIHIQAPDTDVTPYSSGPWGLRVTISGGNAVKQAAEDARKKLFQLAAEMLEANPEDLTIEDRKIYVRGCPEKKISISEVAKTSIYRRGGSEIIGKGIDERDTMPLDWNTMYGNDSSAKTFAAQIAEVEVDTVTGQVKLLKFVSAHDLGKAINPMAAEGQIEGGLVQGIGYGLMEERLEENGKILNPNFLGYHIPAAFDMPTIKTILVESIDPNGPFGAKGVAMPPLILAPPAIANAIYDAVGVRIKELPITPEKILRALEEKERR